MGDGSTGIAGFDLVIAWCLGIGAVVGVGTLAFRALRRGRRLLRMVDAFADDWQGTEDRPGVPGRPGVMKRLCGIEQRLTGVERNMGRVLLDAPAVDGQQVRSA